MCRLLVEDGYTVIGTTRRPRRAAELEAIGVLLVIVDVEHSSFPATPFFKIVSIGAYFRKARIFCPWLDVSIQLLSIKGFWRKRLAS